MRLTRMAKQTAMTAILAAGFAVPAISHPHVFADARLDVVLSAEGNVTSLQHLWRFDDLFSSTVLVEFDKNGDLKLDDGELAAVGQTVKESLAEYGYFQVVTAAGKDVAMNKPDKLTADFGTWKMPWGDVNRFQRISPAIVHPFDDSKPSIPVPFAQEPAPDPPASR